jgi:hypothetical protein
LEVPVTVTVYVFGLAGVEWEPQLSSPKITKITTPLRNSLEFRGFTEFLSLWTANEATNDIHPKLRTANRKFQSWKGSMFPDSAVAGV